VLNTVSVDKCSDRDKSERKSVEISKRSPAMSFESESKKISEIIPKGGFNISYIETPSVTKNEHMKHVQTLELANEEVIVNKVMSTHEIAVGASQMYESQSLITNTPEISKALPEKFAELKLEDNSPDNKQNFVLEITGRSI
jgi:hypothetical protein